MVYPGLSYNLAFRRSKLDSNPSLIRVQEILFTFLGVQWAPNPDFNLFATGGFPLLIEGNNPQQELVRNSYSLISLGFRYGL